MIWWPTFAAAPLTSATSSGPPSGSESAPAPLSAKRLPETGVASSVAMVSGWAMASASTWTIWTIVFDDRLLPPPLWPPSEKTIETGRSPSAGPAPVVRKPKDWASALTASGVAAAVRDKATPPAMPLMTPICWPVSVSVTRRMPPLSCAVKRDPMSTISVPAPLVVSCRLPPEKPAGKSGSAIVTPAKSGVGAPFST